MTSDLIRVLIVEDSPLAAKVLVQLINSDPKLKVIGCVSSGEEALDFIKHVKPDVIVMDIVLPNMDGFETTHHIMQSTPIPIIIASASFDPKDVHKSFKAIDAGALEILEKPSGPLDPAFPAMAEALLKAIKNAAIIQLTTRRYFSERSMQIQNQKKLEDLVLSNIIQAIGIGASLGGPTALKSLFSHLPAKFPIPIFIVQHIAAGFNKGFVDWLQSTSSLKVKLAVNGEIPQPGCVYIAPESVHLEVGLNQKIHLNEDLPVENLRPSVGRLFRSMAKAYGKHSMGILLTGMGHDGAADLLLMRESGAITIAQDKESSFIFGMPKQAISLGAAQFVLSLQQIIDLLNLLAKKKC